MLSPTTIKPVTATPRSQLKRKHGEIVDLTSQDGEHGSVPHPSHTSEVANNHVQIRERQLGDDEFSFDDGDENDSGDDADDDDEMLEDALDEIELNPYRPRKYSFFDYVQ